MNPWLFEGPFRRAGTDRVIKATEILMHTSFLEVPAVLTKYLAVLTRLTGLSFRDLAGLYFGKNVLNRFRREIEKRDGFYQRIWNGREDNCFLREFLEPLDIPTNRNELEQFETRLRTRFSEVYKKSRQKAPSCDKEINGVPKEGGSNS